MNTIELDNMNQYYEEENEEDENLIIDTIDEKQTIFYSVWNKLKTPFLKVCLHINIHLKFLCLLEPLFYFLYASELESYIFIDKLNNIITQILKPIDNFLISNKKLKELVNDLTLKYKKEKDNSIKLKNESNHNLFLTSLYPFYITLIVLLILSCITKKYTSISIKLIYLEHFLLMVFVGLYEYWFFTKILINFKPVSDYEILYLVFDIFNHSLSDKSSISLSKSAS